MYSLEALFFPAVLCLHVIDHGLCVLPRGRVSSQIPGLNFALGQDGLNPGLELLGVVLQAHVVQHLGCAEEHGSRVSHILA